MINRAIISIIFLVVFGILGYHYFNDTVDIIDHNVKNILGLEQTRELMPTSLPIWASTAFGSIVGWGLKGLLMWIYDKFLKDRFKKRRVEV